MKVEQKRKKLLALILALAMCLTMLPHNAYAEGETAEVQKAKSTVAAKAEEPAAEESPAGEPVPVDLETLKATAQTDINALPDTSAEGFAVTAKNVDGYKQQLVTASNTIAAYIQAGGTDDQLNLTRFDKLSAAIGDFDGGVAPAAEKMTFREYVISILEKGDVTVSPSISDDDLDELIYDNYELFIDIVVPTNKVKDLDYLSKMWLALREEYSYVSLPTEFSYATIREALPAGTDYNSNKALKPQCDVWNTGDPYFEIKGVDIRPEPTAKSPSNPFWFVDAIPATYYLPVPPVFTKNTEAAVDEFEYARALSSKDQVEKEVTITRDRVSTRVDMDDDFDCSLITSGSFTVGTRYGLNIYTAVGSSGGDNMACNQSSVNVKTPINVKYSVSLEPITAGAKNGTPTLAGYETSTKTGYPTYSQYPGEENPGRSLANSTTNINRGMNATTDSSGSNSGGADIRGTVNGDGTFSSGTYTAGSGTDSDTIAEEKIHTGAENGTRTTGFANYGAKGISVANNADTDQGFEVDYYEAQVFHPVTGEAMGWVQKDGSVGDTKAKLTESQMNGYLSGTGISGKTKIYVAYKSKVSFTKTNDKTSANPLTATLVGEQNLPNFVLYSDKDCTKYAIDSDLDGQTTQKESAFSYKQATGEVTLSGIPNLLEGETAPKTYYMKESAPGFAQDGKVYAVKIDKDGTVSFDSAEGFNANGESYSLPNTPLPVNLKLQANKTLDGKTDKLITEQFKFVLKQTGMPEGVEALIPEKGIEVYNKANGSIDFDKTMTFSEPGTYTFTLQEDANYRKAGMTDEDYQGITFDDAQRTIRVVVRWADKDKGDADAEKGLKAIVFVKIGNKAEKEIGTVLGTDTNTIDDEKITSKPATIDAETFANTSSRTTEISVNKIWKDNNNHDGFRPKSVTIQLYAQSGTTKVHPVEGFQVTLNKDNNWADRFTNLPKYENGNLITYSVSEVDIPKGYGASYQGNQQNGFTVTNTYKVPLNPSYIMDKVRVDDAPSKNGLDNAYGFMRGTVVTYKATVTNTGNIPLTMDVADAYEEKAVNYFADITYLKITGDGVVWNNDPSNKEGTKTSPNISIQPGKKATITITAKITDSALEYLAPTTQDDRFNDNDGYINTVSVTNVTGTYIDVEGNEQTITKDTVIKDEDNNDVKPFEDSLKDKTDNANTPVQETEGISFAPSVTKKIKGDTPDKKDPFTFKIAGETGKEPMPLKDTIVIQGEGTDLFNPISYTEEGTWNYTVTELEGTDTHYTYDKTVYKMQVVIEDKKGHLEATVKINGKNGVTTMKFVNTYQNDKTIIPDDNSTNNKLTDSVETGDTSMGLELYFMLMLISGVVIVMIARKRRRND